MIAEMRHQLQELLGREVSEPVLLAGGASKEAWAVDADGEKLLVRRAAVGVIHKHTLSLADEFAVLEAASEADVKVPRPIVYIADLDGREAFVMERLEGETIGRRIVRKEELEHARFLLPVQMAEELAKIHGIARDLVPFLEEARLERMIEEFDEVGEPRPAIELGLWWLRENPPAPREPVVVHGDFRIGNLVVDENGLRGILDWEFAHIDDPARDLAFSLVRAWRFGVPQKRLGGIGDVEPYLERYVDLTGRNVTLDELLVWEVFGNVKWAIGCLTQSRRHLNGQDRSVEYAVLGRMAAEMEYELLDLIEHAA